MASIPCLLIKVCTAHSDLAGRAPSSRDRQIARLNRIFASALILPAFFSASAFASEHKTYTNPVFLYAVDYPEDWRIKEVGKAVSVSSPFESKDDKFAENVQIVAEDLSRSPSEVTLIDYHRAGLKNAEKFLADFKALEEAQTRWLDRDTVVMLYSMTLRGEKFRCKDYKFAAGKTFYVLTYYATEENFEKYLPAAERVMKSIRVSP